MRRIPSMQMILAQEAALDEAFIGSDDLQGAQQDMGAFFLLAMLQLSAWEEEGRARRVNASMEFATELARATRSASQRLTAEDLDRTIAAAFTAMRDWVDAGRPRTGPVSEYYIGQISTLGYWLFFLPVLRPGPLLQILANRATAAPGEHRCGDMLVGAIIRARDGLYNQRIDISVVETFWDFLGVPLYGLYE